MRFVNVMARYRPQYQVGRPGRDGRARDSEIDRRPGDEIECAHLNALGAGLWRFGTRWIH